MSARTDVEATQVQHSTGVTPEHLEEILVQQLDATYVQIEDLSGTAITNTMHLSSGWLTPCIGGCGQMFEAIIVSPQFAKKMTLARHRLVNTVLKNEIAAIHAWTPKCFTPEEWEKKQGQA